MSCNSYACKCRRFTIQLRLTSNEPQAQPSAPPSDLDLTKGLYATTSRPKVLNSPAREERRGYAHRPRNNPQGHPKVTTIKNAQADPVRTKRWVQIHGRRYLLDAANGCQLSKTWPVENIARQGRGTRSELTPHHRVQPENYVGRARSGKALEKDSRKKTRRLATKSLQE